jgi:hypothetical protein
MTAPRPNRIPPSNARLIARFDRQVDTGPGCWTWRGTYHRSGYGLFSINGHWYRAHRVAYAWLVGPAADGTVHDHGCRNRWCVNPACSEQVTLHTNTLRGVGPTAVNANKTHCHRGHELAGANLRIEGRSRRCVACKRIVDRAAHARRRARRWAQRSSASEAADAGSFTSQNRRTA